MLTVTFLILYFQLDTNLIQKWTLQNCNSNKTETKGSQNICVGLPLMDKI